MKQMVTCVTLGTSDLARARRFYEALGWQSTCAADSEVVFFQCGGMVLSLWSRDELAADSGVALGSGFGAVTLALNVESPVAVDAVIAEAEAAGAKIAKAPNKTFWGGYSGVFLDPDEHPWEIAHNPDWTLGADGGVTLAA
jgi:uncharacterized protein